MSPTKPSMPKPFTTPLIAPGTTNSTIEVEIIVSTISRTASTNKSLRSKSVEIPSVKAALAIMYNGATIPASFSPSDDKLTLSNST